MVTTERIVRKRGKAAKALNHQVSSEHTRQTRSGALNPYILCGLGTRGAKKWHSFRDAFQLRGARDEQRMPVQKWLPQSVECDPNQKEHLAEDAKKEQWVRRLVPVQR